MTRIAQGQCERGGKEFFYSQYMNEKQEYFLKIILPYKTEISFKFSPGDHSPGRIMDSLAKEWLLVGRVDFKKFECISSSK